MLAPLAFLLIAQAKPPSWQQQTAAISLPYVNKYIPAAIKALGKLKRKKK